jgi:hypothetical protein
MAQGQMAQKQKQNRRGVLRRSMRWGAAVVATTATGAAASGGCAPGGTGGAETARLSSVPVTIRFPTEATPPNEAYLVRSPTRCLVRWGRLLGATSYPSTRPE